MVTNEIQKKWELEIRDDPEASVSVYEVDISDINQKKVQVLVQNGDIGRFWTPLTPWIHWIWSYMWNNFLWKEN